MKKIEGYLKPFAQAVATALSAILIVLVDHENLTRTDWLNVIMTGLGALMVAGAGNVPDGVWRYAKSIVSAAMAALVIVNTVWATGGSLETRHWIEIILAVLATLGVRSVKGPLVEQVAPARGRHEAR